VATIQIRNVPDEVHRRLQARAAMAGQSLQEYMLTRLIAEAAAPTVGELMAEVERDLRIDPDGFAESSVADTVRGDRTSH
jgi:plasmid stability protein